MPAALWFAIGAAILCAITSVYLGTKKIILLQGLHKRPFYLCRLCLCRMKSMKEHRMEDINGSRPNAAPKPKKRPNRFVRFLAFLVTLALMVGAVAWWPTMTS